MRLIPGILTVAFAVSASAAAADSPRTVRLASVDGAVQVEHADGQRQDAAVPGALRQGERLVTGPDGRAIIEWENDNSARLLFESSLLLHRLTLDNGRRATVMSLERGSACFTVSPRTADSFEVTFSGSVSEATRLSQFCLEVNGDKLRLIVAEGSVSFRAGATGRSVERSQSLAWDSQTGAIEVLSGGQPRQEAGPAITALPDGLILAVRLETPLSTKASKVGDPVELATDIDLTTTEGEVVVPKGSIMRGKVSFVQPHSKEEGKSQLAIEMDELHVGSSIVPIRGVVSGPIRTPEKVYQAIADIGRVGGSRGSVTLPSMRGTPVYVTADIAIVQDAKLGAVMERRKRDMELKIGSVFQILTLPTE